MTAGLRERKKMRTRAAIQKQAIRLFLQKGYGETTIEDIAEAVEISPSTFFNYFPSKEAVVFQDDLDPLIIAAFNAQPPHVNPITAMRRALKTVLAKIPASDEATVRERIALVTSTPELRAAMLNAFAELLDEISVPIAERVGRKADDFAVRNMAGAILGVLISAYFATAANREADFLQELDKAMAHLEAGLPL
jgi:AcrR family transcriptional regulator